MPRFLEEKLKARYGADSDVPYKVLNAIGAMHGNKTTAKGEAMQKKHDEDVKAGKKFAQGGMTAGAGSGSGREEKAEHAKAHPKGFSGGGSAYKGSQLTTGRPPGMNLRVASESKIARGYAKGGGVELRGNHFKGEC